jgi:hypothetical protein
MEDDDLPPMHLRFTLTGWQPPPPIAPKLREAGSQFSDGVFNFTGLFTSTAEPAMIVFGGAGALIGAIGCAVAMLCACLAIGPIGWLLGLVLVPLAWVVGQKIGLLVGIITLFLGPILLIAALVDHVRAH